MNHGDEAVALFKAGYNCAQSVFAAFRDLTGYTMQDALLISSSFGGGMARMREVCGAISGIFMVAGVLYGYDSPTDREAKMSHYSRIQALAAQFREKRGSIVCRELLKNPPSDPVPSERNAEYYAKRPCAYIVYDAAKLMDDYIAQNPPEVPNA